MAAEAGDAADGDHPTACAFHHLRHDFAADQDAGHQVAIEHGADVFQRYVHGVVLDGFPGLRAGRALRADIAAGVVDENVDVPETLADLCGQALDRGVVRQIAVDGEHVRVVGFRDRRGDRFERIGLVESTRRNGGGAVDGDFRTEAGEMVGDDAPDAARGAGHPRNFACESLVHSFILAFRSSVCFGTRTSASAFDNPRSSRSQSNADSTSSATSWYCSTSSVGMPPIMISSAPASTISPMRSMT